MPRAKIRHQVVNYGKPVEDAGAESVGPVGDGEGDGARTRPNYTWADLMRRCFDIDVLKCPECGGQLRLLAPVFNPTAVRAILTSLGLTADTPDSRIARPPPATN